MAVVVLLTVLCILSALLVYVYYRRRLVCRPLNISNLINYSYSITGPLGLDVLAER